MKWILAVLTVGTSIAIAACSQQPDVALTETTQPQTASSGRPTDGSGETPMVPEATPPTETTIEPQTLPTPAESPTPIPPEAADPTETPDPETELPNSPTPTSATNPPSITAPSTTPKVTETTSQGDFFSGLSSQERECLGPEIRSGRDFLAMLPTSPTTGTEVIRCLSEENQFQLYMSNDPGPEDLKEATHRCIWNSMAQLLELDDPHTDSPTESNLMEQMMTMMVAMPLYCAATHQPDLDSDHLGFDEEEANYIVCAIEAAGGRSAWIRMLRENGANFQVFLQAEETCG